MSTLDAFLSELIDDAGLFPPATLPMSEALAAHLRTRMGPWSSLVGRFLCPASRCDELLDAAPRVFGGEVLRLGLIADAGVDSVFDAMESIEQRRAEDHNVLVEVIEIAAESAQSIQVGLMAMAFAGEPGVETFVEIPREDGWEFELADSLSALRSSHVNAKFRTGGVAAGAFPSEDEVATFIEAAIEATVPFKLTAGLHHAVRHTDSATGFEHHGFLNVALAVAHPREARRWLREREGVILADALRTIDSSTVRSRWRAFGSCSIEEPVEDLIALNLVDKT